MIDGNESAMPFVLPRGEDDFSVGMTKREYFAVLAMNGFLASWGQHDLVAAEEIAHDSVCLADALIKELNKTEK